MKFVVITYIILFLNSLVNLTFLAKPNTLKTANKVNTSSKHSKKFYKQVFREVVQNFDMIKGNITKYTELIHLIDAYTSAFEKEDMNNIHKNSKLRSLVGNFNSSIFHFHQLQQSFNKTYKNFEEFMRSDYDLMRHFKKKRKRNTMIFYNSMSMVMLSMLAGGLVGLVFILYFTSESKPSECT